MITFKPLAIRALTLAILLFSFIGTQAQTPFTRVKTGPVATDVEQSVGAAWGDYDNDGFLDLFVVNFGASPTNTLYHNNKDGTFTRVRGGAPVDEPGSGHGCVWGDFDNDGYLDLFVCNLLTTNRLYRNNGDGTFQKMGGTVGSDYPGYSVSASLADFDADGYLDLFVANGALVANKVDSLYRNLGRWEFANIASTGGLDQALRSTQGTWADVDGDGRIDLFVTHHANQGNFLYRNQGKAGFLAVSNGLAFNEQLNSVGSAWGDYDNDGDLDLFVVNRGSSQRNNFYRNQGGGVFEKITTGVLVTQVGMFNSCAWVDYDNDGYLDLFVVDEAQRNRIYRNNGDGTFANITQGNLVNDIATSIGCAWGDYDNDGFVDVFVANGGLLAPQQNFLYHNNGNSNHWIKVRCVGTISNRSAIGAIVRVKAVMGGATVWQMRQITGGDGWLSQNSLDVSIGLRDATNIELIRIEWPSGIIQESTDVTPNQTLIIEEPARLELDSRQSASSLLLKGGGRDAFGRLREYDLETSGDLTRWLVWTHVVVTNFDGVAVLPTEPATDKVRFFRARRSAAGSVAQEIGLGRRL